MDAKLISKTISDAFTKLSDKYGETFVWVIIVFIVGIVAVRTIMSILGWLGIGLAIVVTYILVKYFNGKK